MCPIVSVWSIKHLFTKYLLSYSHELLPFLLWSPRLLPPSPWFKIYSSLSLTDCLWNLCPWIPVCSWLKFVFYSPVNLSHVSLSLRPARRILKSRGVFFLPNRVLMYFLLYAWLWVSKQQKLMTSFQDSTIKLKHHTLWRTMSV